MIQVGRAEAFDPPYRDFEIIMLVVRVAVCNNV